MKKFLMVFGAFWLIGFLLGMHVASLSDNEMKSSGEYVSYMNANRKIVRDRGDLVAVEVPVCEFNYVYNVANDSLLPRAANLSFKKSNKMGFGQLSASGIIIGLGLLGAGELSEIRKNAYAVAKQDWKAAVLGVLGAGVGFGLGYYLKYKGQCDTEQAGLVQYLNNKQSWQSYVQGIPKKGVIVPLNRQLIGVKQVAKQP